MNIDLQREIDDCNKHIKAIDFSLSLQENCIVSHGWILVDAKDETCAFEIELEPVVKNGKRRYRAIDAKAFTSPHKANRFTEKDARALAKSIQNGNGHLRAVHWIDAAKAHRARMVDLRDMFVASQKREANALN